LEGSTLYVILCHRRFLIGSPSCKLLKLLGWLILS
jgi:hypothetical protein